MDLSADGRDAEISQHVTEIVAAYVTNNNIPQSDVAALIVLISDAVRGLYVPTQAEAKRRLPTQAEISKSITQDFLVSFIDGKSYRTLTRHLRTHGLDASRYRSRYGLPVDYPMVAPSYSARRSEISRSLASRNRPRP